MRLVNWDKVLEWMHRQKETTEQWSMRIAIENYVDEMPTVDAVEVVRCKDCKYMTEHYDTDGNVPYWTCSEWDSGTDYDGYCHYGERRGNDKSIRA